MNLTQKLKAAWFAFSCGKSAERLEMDLLVSNRISKELIASCFTRAENEKLDDYIINVGGRGFFFSRDFVEELVTTK